eukprot:m.192225 g.192225  ORF g.192225 m.192225 type:complete len:139 (-) comp53651_c0_seq7:28-444(-)
MPNPRTDQPTACVEKVSNPGTTIQSQEPNNIATLLHFPQLNPGSCTAANAPTIPAQSHHFFNRVLLQRKLSLLQPQNTLSSSPTKLLIASPFPCLKPLQLDPEIRSKQPTLSIAKSPVCSSGQSLYTDKFARLLLSLH